MPRSRFFRGMTKRLPNEIFDQRVMYATNGLQAAGRRRRPEGMVGGGGCTCGRDIDT